MRRLRWTLAFVLFSTSLVEPAQAADSTARAQDIEFVFDGSTVRIPRIEVSGTRLSDAELAAIFESKQPASFRRRLQKLAAENVSIPLMTIVDAKSGVPSEMVIENTRLAHLEDGRISSYTTGRIVMRVGGPPLAPLLTISMRRTGTKNFDLGRYIGFFVEPRRGSDEPAVRVYESGFGDDIELKTDGVALKVSKWTLGEAKLRPLAVSVDAFTKAMSGDPRAKRTAEQSRLSRRWTLDLYDSIDAGRMTFEGVSGTFGGKEGVVMKLGRLDLDLRKSVGGNVAFSDFSLAAPPTLAVSFETFQFSGVDMRGPIVAAAAYAPDDPSAAAVDPRAFVPPIGGVLLRNLDAHLPATRGNADNGHGSTFKVAKVDLKASNHLLGVPTVFSGVVEHLTLPLSEHDPAMQPMLLLGYRSADLGYRFAYAWNEGASTLTLHELSLTGAGMGTLTAKGTIVDVGTDLFAGDSALMQSALLRAKIKDVELHAEDTGFLDRVLEAQARAAKTNVDRVRQALITSAREGIARLFGVSAQAKASADAIVAFIENPKSITIAATSAKGFGATELPLLQSPSELLRRLDVRATANR